MSTGGTAIIEGIEVSTDHWIGGNRVGSPDAFTDISPIDEQPIAEVARGGEHEAAAAVAAARGAFSTSGMSPISCGGPRDADGVEARVPELAAVETRDNGSVLSPCGTQSCRAWRATFGSSRTGAEPAIPTWTSTASRSMCRGTHRASPS